MTTAVDANSPAWRDPKIAKWDAQRTRCADVLDGLDALRDKASTYNPKLPRETPQNYQIRLSLAELTNLLGFAVRASEGLITAKPPQLEDAISPELRAIAADVDGFGTGLSVWLRSVVRAMLAEGGVVAVVSTPVRVGQRPNRLEERELQLRPYVVLYRIADVMSPRFQRIGGKQVLTQLVLRERVEEPSGLYGMKVTTQYRVLRRLSRGQHVVLVLRENERGEFVRVGTPDVLESDELPVVEFSAMPADGFAKAPPPVVDLADLTLSHWRISTDRRWAMRQTCFPWLVRIGYVDDGQGTAVGPSEALDLPPGGDAKFIAPSDTAMQPTRDELTDIERRAAAFSLSFLAGEHPGADQTATAANIDQEGQDAGLAAIIVSLRDALNKLFAVFDELLGNAPRDSYVQMPTKLRGLRRDPAFVRLVLDTWKEGGLPLEAMLYALKQGELPDDFDIEQAALDAIAEADADREAEAERLRAQNAENPDSAGDNGATAA